MFAKVLDCPECEHRFNFEYEDDILPGVITCPRCGVSNYSEKYFVLLFCPECRAKLKVAVNIYLDPNLSCPECGALLKVNDSSLTAPLALNSNASNTDTRCNVEQLFVPGDVFDKYQIISLLGKGGMAEVYYAEDLLLKRRCALKLMHNTAAVGDPVTVKRFLREAKLAHQLDHPNIIKVFDVGKDLKTGYPFMAMEYVEGQTLHELVKERELSEKELTDVLKSMAHALNILHDARIVHRDIKPSNIMCDKHGVYKLMDLGIAKSENFENNDESGALTVDLSSIGTPNYSSPEQCRSAHDVDCRSDIYSLGAALYHLASGKLPFSGATPVETILNVMQHKLVPLRTYRPDLSDKFLNLIEKMMAKAPEERPETPDVLLAEVFRAVPAEKMGWAERKMEILREFDPDISDGVANIAYRILKWIERLR